MSQSFALSQFAVLHDAIGHAQRAWQRLNAALRAQRVSLELESISFHQARDIGLLEQYRDSQEGVSRNNDRISGIASAGLGVRAGPLR